MIYNEFLAAVIDRGMAAAKRDYVEPMDKRRLDGSIAGFAACCNQTPETLQELLRASCRKANDPSLWDDLDKYWYERSYQLEVEWVCNCVSVILVNENMPAIIPPTANAVLTVADILNVSPRTFEG